MNDSARLERGYRRLLAFYPRAYRRENEQEILAVLMACAQDGQRRPGLATAADLLRSALLMRLGTAGRRPPRAVFNAARLMCLSAMVQVVGVIIYAGTASGVHAAILQRYPGLTAAEWHGVMAQLHFDEIGGPVTAAVWLWLAWANARGRQWARLAFTTLFILGTLGEIVVLAQGSVLYAPADMAVSLTAWFLGLVAMALIFTRQSDRYYRRRPVAAVVR